MLAAVLQGLLWSEKKDFVCTRSGVGWIHMQAKLDVLEGRCLPEDGFEAHDIRGYVVC